MADYPEPAEIRAVYDTVADDYAGKFFDELDRKQFDRDQLDEFAAQVAGRGPVVDIGCGPGHIARYLGERGVDAFGLDLSPGSLKVGASRTPGLAFVAGDMIALPLRDESCAGVVAFYSVIHLPRPVVPSAFAEFRRVMAPDGLLLVACHGGEGEVRNERWFDRPVQMVATLFQPDELAGYARNAGFTVEAAATRPPYEFEYPSERVYLSARAG